MSDTEQPAVLRTVQHPVTDVGAAVGFYRDALGLAVTCQDGDRYAALDAGGPALALAGPSEDITGGLPAASFKVTDVAAALAAIEQAGGSVLRPPEQGPHEVRAVARDPWGNPLIVYAPRA